MTIDPPAPKPCPACEARKQRVPTAADADGVPFAFFLTNSPEDLNIQFQKQLVGHIPHIYSAEKH